ncbi:MAG: SDR family NAD(P)-dependent oxidoreductase [Alphaproteobacteria bacterium]|nr:SDR family NAD(P)-dependent oxidoreductase [Alphaproteobacteria bacterium]
MKDPKSILITGASSGIGKALALHYAAPGVFLALGGRNAERLEEVAKLCEKRGAIVTFELVDVCDAQVIREWVEAAFDKSAGLDLVIANAGISGGTSGRKEGEPLSEARRIFDVNLYGVLNTVEPALEKMKQYPQNGQKGGQIAVMASLAGFRGWPSAPSYSASKGAVRMYGEALRGSLKHYPNIAVNVICPGFVTSPMTDVNDFPMPFKISAERAARIIAAGLAKNKSRIAFPWVMYGIVGLIGMLPDWLAQIILKDTPEKSSFGQ